MMLSRLIGLSLVVLSFLIASGSSRADAPAARVAVLARGLNISHWFRFPARNDAAAFCCYLDDRAIASLKSAGFTFVRLPVGPEEVMQGDHIVPAKRAAIVSAISRLEHAGLAVLIDPNPERVENWQLDRNAEARAKLLGFWTDLAPSLRSLSPGLTFPELVNEPAAVPARWDELQRQLLAVVRSALPDNTVILTGTNWSSIDGLLKVMPVSDTNVVYSFHTYEPQLLTLLAVWDHAIKPNQLAQALPFPVKEPASCSAQVAAIQDAHTLATARYWCSLHQDASSISKNLSRAASWGRIHHVSVAMTEFGAVQKLNAPARLAYLSTVRQSAVHLGLPWGLWALDDQMGFNQRPGDYRSLQQLSPSILQTLGLAHEKTPTNE